MGRQEGDNSELGRQIRAQVVREQMIEQVARLNESVLRRAGLWRPAAAAMCRRAAIGSVDDDLRIQREHDEIARAEGTP